MIKYIGIILLCSAISGLGAYLSNATKNSLLTRDELIDFIRHINSGIKYGGTELPGIYSTYSSDILGKCGFIQGLLQNKSISLVVDESLYMLKSDEREKTKEFFSKLGKSHLCEKEMLLCASFIDYLTQAQQKSQKEDTAKALVYKKLGIIASLICAIIFI